jgi:hypothetical protein
MRGVMHSCSIINYTYATKLLLLRCNPITTARQHDGKRTSSTARAAAAAAPTYGTTEETSPTVNEAAGASHFGGEYDSPQKGPTAPVTMTDQEHILHEIQLGTADLEQVRISSSCCSLQLFSVL